MKITVKALFILLIGVISLSANAQTYCIKGGVNMSNMLLSDILYKDNVAYVQRVLKNNIAHVGATLDIPLTPALFFETGLLMSVKGLIIEKYYSTALNLPLHVRTRYNLYDLEVPLVAKAVLSFNDSVKIFAISGFYVGYGIAGKIKTTEQIGDDYQSYKENVMWGNNPDEDMLRRLDGGISIGAGIILNCFEISASYDFGLLNLSPIENAVAKNRVIKFTFGYTFSIGK